MINSAICHFLMVAILYGFITTMAGPTKVFERDYSSDTVSEVRGYYTTTAGTNGYVVVSNKAPRMSGNDSIQISRLDNNFDIKWEKCFKGSSVFGYRCVLKTKDGNLIILSEIDKNLYRLFKIDFDGNILWDRNYNLINNNEFINLKNSPNYMVESNKGNIFLTGTIIDTTKDVFNIFLMKFNSAGDSLWKKIYEDSCSRSANTMLQTSSGDYILAGDKYINEKDDFSFSKIYFMCVDENGIKKWEKTIGKDSTVCRAFCVQPALNNRYVVLGTYSYYFDPKIPSLSESANYILSLNSNLDTIWTDTVMFNEQDWPTGIIQLTNGDYLIAGCARLTYQSSYDFYMLPIDVNGKKGNIITCGGEKDEYCYSLNILNNNNFILTGTTGSYSDNESLYLVDFSVEDINKTIKPLRSINSSAKDRIDKEAIYSLNGRIIKNYSSLKRYSQPFVSQNASKKIYLKLK